MTDADLLVMLETNLELITDYMDAASKAAKEAELGQYLGAAEGMIGTEGIVIDKNDVSDCMLLVLYAAWLYDKRKNADAVMPRMLRWNLNNRLFSRKMGG